LPDEGTDQGHEAGLSMIRRLDCTARHGGRR
jgi:hypothetical protein